MAAPEIRDRVRLSNPVHCLALGFGSGLARKAPGTAGTMAAVPVWLLVAQLPLDAYLLVTALVCLLGIPICGRAARDFGVHDHPAIVWDEIAGFLVTMVAAPVGWLWALLGFVLFRLFDILKPWPIRVLDRRVHGGFGIMIDDIAAGILAALVLQAVALILV